MLPSIELDNQPLIEADEVHDVASQRVLTAKLASFELTQPYTLP